MKRLALALLSVVAPSLVCAEQTPIDRHALVTRHNPVIRQVDVDAPLTVGNGGFAFTADITGLQTFAGEYHRLGVPVETESRWCWVTDSNPQNYTLADASKDFTQADGKVIPYPTKQSSPAGDWLRKNPRIHPLGQITLDWKKEDGTPFTSRDIQQPEQTLDLWAGVITSRYQLGDVPVTVTTACAPGSDCVAVKIDSALLAHGKLSVHFGFPRGYDAAIKLTPPLDWSHPESHQTVLTRPNPQRVDLSRTVGSTQYHVAIAWSGSASLAETAPHHFALSAPSGQNSLSFTCAFSPNSISTEHPPSTDDIFDQSAKQWSAFWQNGAAVDFSGSTDPRANQIEERIILSRYLMATQMAGEVPPQETGLTCSTWYGKHHSEMIWWHTAQFALWVTTPCWKKIFRGFKPNSPPHVHSRLAGVSKAPAGQK